VGVDRPSFWEKPWQLALIAVLTLLVLAPVIAGVLSATGHHCTAVAACITGDPRLDQNRPCLQPGQPLPRNPC
jgi:hypothetical protein